VPRRVVLVTRNPGLGFGLESIGWEVVEVRDRELDLLTAPQGAGDALVLDLRDPARASSAVADLRSRGITTPVLLVAGTSPAWASVAASELSATQILELPASRERLQTALNRLVATSTTPSADTADLGDLGDLGDIGDDETERPGLGSQPPVPSGRGRGRHAAVPAPPAAAEPEPEAAAAEVPALSLSTRAQGVSDAASEAISDAAVVAATPVRQAVAPDSAQEAAETVEVVGATDAVGEVDELVEQSDAPDVADGALARVLAGQHITAPPTVTRPRGFPPRPTVPSAPPPPAEPTPTTARPTRPSPSPSGDVAGLVEALAARADELYSVSETGQVVAEQALETVAADASVVFVPDDGGWRVVGGVGLRPLERRAVLSRDSWLVDVVALSHRGVVVEDSDIARSRLGGVPLAHLAHLLAVPVPAVDGLVLLARAAELAFTQDDVAALSGLSGEAGALLQAAVRARGLARSLSRLVDRPDAHR
jgi:hypothetical protein